MKREKYGSPPWCCSWICYHQVWYEVNIFLDDFFLCHCCNLAQQIGASFQVLKGNYYFPERFYSLSASKWIWLFCNFSKISEFDKIQIFGTKMERSDNNSFTAEKTAISHAVEWSLPSCAALIRAVLHAAFPGTCSVQVLGAFHAKQRPMGYAS